MNTFIEAVIADFHGSDKDASSLLYPDERGARARADAIANGVPVDPAVSAAVCLLTA